MAESSSDDEYPEAVRLVARGREQRGAAEGLLQDARQLLGQTIASAQDAVDTVVQTVFGGDGTLATQVPRPPPPWRPPGDPRGRAPRGRRPPLPPARRGVSRGPAGTWTDRTP